MDDCVNVYVCLAALQECFAVSAELGKEKRRRWYLERRCQLITDNDVNLRYQAKPFPSFQEQYQMKESLFARF